MRKNAGQVPTLDPALYFNSCRIFNTREKTEREIAPMHSSRKSMSSKEKSVMILKNSMEFINRHQEFLTKHKKETEPEVLETPVVEATSPEVLKKPGKGEDGLSNINKTQKKDSKVLKGKSKKISETTEASTLSNVNPDDKKMEPKVKDARRREPDAVIMDLVNTAREEYNEENYVLCFEALNAALHIRPTITLYLERAALLNRAYNSSKAFINSFSSHILIIFARNIAGTIGLYFILRTTFFQNQVIETEFLLTALTCVTLLGSAVLSFVPDENRSAASMQPVRQCREDQRAMISLLYSSGVCCVIRVCSFTGKVLTAGNVRMPIL